MSTGDPRAADSIIISVPESWSAAQMTEERDRLLSEVHPGTAVVITRGVAQHAELTALAVRAFTLLDAKRSTSKPAEAASWDSERARWMIRYHAYLEDIHAT
jgi:hypothetical protein